MEETGTSQECAACCTLVTYVPDVAGGGVWQVSGFNIFILVAMLLSVVFLLWQLWAPLWSLRARTHRMYFNSMVLLAASYFFEIVILLLPFSPTKTDPSSTYALVSNFSYQIALAVRWVVELQLCIFLCYKGTEEHSLRRSVVLSLQVVFPLTCVAFIGITLAWQWRFAAGIEGVWTILFSLFILMSITGKSFAQFSRGPRPWLKFWASYVTFFHLLFFLTYLARVLAQAGNPHVFEGYACLLIFSKTFLVASFVPVFYLMSRRDGAFLKDDGARHLQEALIDSDSEYEIDDFASGDHSSSKPPTDSASSPGPRKRATLQGLVDDGQIRKIPSKEVNIGNVIGAGQYGDVYKATWKGTSVAIKKFRIDPKTSFDKYAAGVAKEISLLARLDHPNVLSFLGMVIEEEPPVLMMVTEFMPRGSLFDLIGQARQGRFAFTNDVKLGIMRNISSGLAFLHSLDPVVIHRDLKSHNLLIDEDLTCKICDFGISRVKELTQTMTRVGTPQWMAPEVLRGEKYSEKSDVFSFGVVMWELLSEKRPFPSVLPLRVATMVAYDQLRLPLPNHVDPRVVKLVKRCWEDSPNKRPSFQEIQKILQDLGPNDLYSGPPIRRSSSQLSGHSRGGSSSSKGSIQSQS